uniref:Uncharacterized protein n=1 Tax=Arundo donax TaxID=35708 RepID=A0A0A9H7B4_ARUDO
MGQWISSSPPAGVLEPQRMEWRCELQHHGSDTGARRGIPFGAGTAMGELRSILVRAMV